MIMSDRNSNGLPSFQSLAVIWIAIFWSQALFLVLIYVIRPELFNFDLSRPAAVEDPLLPALFGVLSVVLFVTSLAMKRRFVNRAVDLQNPALLQTALVVGCAMCEAVSLFGVVLAVGHNSPYFFIWIAAGMAGMLFHFPSRTNLKNATFDNKKSL